MIPLTLDRGRWDVLSVGPPGSLPGSGHAVEAAQLDPCCGRPAPGRPGEARDVADARSSAVPPASSEGRRVVRHPSRMTCAVRGGCCHRSCDTAAAVLPADGAGPG